jgi:hypothetical protein
MLKKWAVPITVTISATAHVEAETLEEALEEVNDMVDEMEYNEFDNQETSVEIHEDEAVNVE